MKVILLKDVQKVGKKFDIKDVADGFALNSLIPKGLAKIADKSGVKQVEETKAKEAKEKKMIEDALNSHFVLLKDSVVEIKAKGSEKGHLFASIHNNDIIDACGKFFKKDVDARILAQSHTIKESGNHSIEIKAGDKKATFTLKVSIID